MFSAFEINSKRACALGIPRCFVLVDKASLSLSLREAKRRSNLNGK
jgi:hypothetical protein